VNFAYVTGHTFGDLEQQRVHSSNFDTTEAPTWVSTMLHATSAAEDLARVSSSLTLPLLPSTAYICIQLRQFTRNRCVQFYRLLFFNILKRMF
jgi:hypothetical protein